MLFFKKSLKNEFPQSYRYFVRHIQSGLVAYGIGEKKQMLNIPEETLMAMDKTFEGKPVYIKHVDASDAQERLDDTVGSVVKSFYNEADGWHWAEILVNEMGKKCFTDGWKVSNSHVPTRYGDGGVHNNVDYAKTLEASEYEHLAIVETPRYEGVLVFTPEEFANYNDGKKKEIESLKNSLEFETMNKDELVKAVSEALIPAIATQIEVALKNAAEEEAKKNADEDHRALIREIAAVSAKDDGEFEGGLEEKIRTIVGLAEKLGYTKDEAKAENEAEEEESKDNSDEAGKEEKDGEVSKDNACHKNEEESKAESDKKEDVKDNEAEDKEEEKEEKEESKKNSLEDFSDVLLNAKNTPFESDEKTVETKQAAVERGKAYFNN